MTGPEGCDRGARSRDVIRAVTQDVRVDRGVMTGRDGAVRCGPAARWDVMGDVTLDVVGGCDSGRGGGT